MAKKSFDQAINEHLIFQKEQFILQNRPAFKKIVKKQNVCYEKNDFPKKIYIKSFMSQ